MQKLIEQFTVNSDQYEKVELSELTENNISFEEGGKKKTFKAEAVYTFPVSRPDEKNLNERIYTTKLWENVIKKMKNSQTYGLMDHPKEEGSTKDAWCVWRNLRFSENKKLILADAYLFGPNGRQVNEALEAGGAVGLSTSGYGEFEKDEITVSPSSYELERVADHVLASSYNVFGTEENRINTEKSESIKETATIKENESTVIEKELDPERKIVMKEQNKMSPLEEKSFRLNIKGQLKEIASMKLPLEKVKALEDLLTYFEEGVAIDLKETVLDQIEKTKTLIAGLVEKSLVPQDTLKEDSLTKELEELKKKYTDVEKYSGEVSEKFTKATELLDSMKVYSNKMKEMYEVAVAEKNGMITATEYKETLSFIDALEEEKEKLIRHITELRIDLPEEKDDEDKDEDDEEVAEKKVKKVKEEKDEDEDKDEKKKVADKNNDEEEVVEKKSKKENWSHVPVEILGYYEDLVYAQPKVENIKKDILSSKTLLEAQRTYLRLKSLLFVEDHERRPSIEESMFFNDFEKKEKRVVKSKLIREGWD